MFRCLVYVNESWGGCFEEDGDMEMLRRTASKLNRGEFLGQ